MARLLGVEIPNEKRIDQRTAEGVIPYAYRRTSLQVARLRYDAGTLTCDRDEAFDFHLAGGPEG